MAKRYHVSRHIDAPAERIWALLTDASSYRAWNRAVVSIEGPITEGATISLVSIVNPRRTFKLKVTEMTPPNTMVWGDSMPLGLFKGERTYRLVKIQVDLLAQVIADGGDGLRGVIAARTSYATRRAITRRYS